MRELTSAHLKVGTARHHQWENDLKMVLQDFDLTHLLLQYRETEKNYFEKFELIFIEL